MTRSRLGNLDDDKCGPMRRGDVLDLDGMGDHTYTLDGSYVMTRSYAEYSATRRGGLVGVDAVAVDVFDRAFALGAALAEARRSRGLKQRELAEISGVDQGDISGSNAGY